jgi:hypothetical protein
MTIKIFDLEQDQSLLVELEEKDVSEIFGGAGATDAAQQNANENVAVQAANAENAKNFQDQSTAIQTDAQFKMKANQQFQSLVQGIKA